MAEAVRNAQQEFWSPPSVLDPPATAVPPAVASEEMADACEWLRQRVHDCRKVLPYLRTAPRSIDRSSTEVRSDAEVIAGLWARNVAWVRNGVGWAADTWREIPFPDWLHYLHFHEIKRWVGLPTAALIAFILGLGCVVGAIGVSLFYQGFESGGVSGDPDVADRMAAGRDGGVCGGNPAEGAFRQRSRVGS
jgi:hypothetical protein